MSEKENKEQKTVKVDLKEVIPPKFSSSTQKIQGAPVGAIPASLMGPDGKPNPELMKMIAAMQEKKLQEMPKYKRIFMQFMQKIMPKMQVAVEHLDRFVNFVTKPTDSDRNDVAQAARAPILFGTWVIIIFFGFGMLWAGLAPLDSASHAMGTVISSTKIKTLQHRAGGTVEKIFVKQGDHVKEGDPIIALDEKQFKFQYGVILNQYRTLKASESRLIAERDNLPNIEFAPELLKDAEQPEVAKILATQRTLFQSKRDLIATLEKHTAQRIEQTKKTIEGYEERKISAHKTNEIWEERLKSAKQLLAKGFMSKSQYSDIESKAADARSNDIGTDAELIKTQQEISRIEIELMQQKSDMLTRTVGELKETQASLAEAEEKMIVAKDDLEKAVIVSPVDGIVNVIHATTIGGVIGPGAPIAEVSPEKDVLIVEAKIRPADIAYLRVGQDAKMNFTAYKSRTTPVFMGKLVSISPDIVMERQQVPGGEAGYYVGMIEIDMKEFIKEKERLNLSPLMPGMQVDVQIIRGTRTLLRYILDPITDNMFKAFKEK